MLSRQTITTSLLMLAFVSGCSKQSEPSILGHWHAERVSMYSVQLPIGPDIVISGNGILNPDTGASIPVQKIESGTGSATVDLPLGVGLTFFFDGRDRMYLKVPVIGHVYYHRVEDNAGFATSGVTSSASVAHAPIGQVGSAAARPVNVEAAAHPGQVQPVVLQASSGSKATAPEASHRIGGDLGRSEYQLALVAASQGNVDASIDRLNDALKHGFRDFGSIESEPELADVRRDIRYQALVGRYK